MKIVKDSISAGKMVLFHVKRGDESQFLYDTSVEKTVDEVVQDITSIFNGRLKVSLLNVV